MNERILGDIVEWAGEVFSTGYWSMDPGTGKVSWSEQAYRILGYEPGTVSPAYDLVRDAFTEDDRAGFDAEVQQALADGTPYLFEGLLESRGGGARRVRAMGKLREDAAEQRPVLVGMIQDVSHEHARHQRMGTALQWLETASELAKLGYWYLDIADHSLEWSDEVYRIHGFEPGAFTPDVDQAIQAYHPEDRDRIADAVRRGQETGEGWSLGARLLRHDGQVRAVMASGRPLYDRNRLVALFGIIQDVSTQQELHEHDQLFVSLVKQTPDGICITDAEGRTEWVNEAFKRITGFSQEEMHGQKPGRLLQGPNTNPETVERIRAALMAKCHFTEDIVNYRKDGSDYWTRLSIFPHHDEDGQLTHYMSIQTDVTAQKATEAKLAEQSRTLEQSNFYLERQRWAAETLSEKDRRMREELEQAVARSRELQDDLRRLAHYDELTGMPNRRYVLKRAEAEHKRAKRYDRPLSLVMADVDYFKRINDEFGHQTGDRAITHVACLLESSLRQGVDICGRFGGEEFILVLPETTLAGAIPVVERARQALEETAFLSYGPTTCSFGICEATQFDTLEQAIKAADDKLYAAKEAGRNRVMY